MKKKFISQWLHRLPVLLLALILAVAPLAMAVPADASSDVLTGSPVSSPSVPGYTPLFSSDQGEGYFLYVYLSDEYLSLINDLSVTLFDPSGPTAYTVWGPEISIVDTTLTWRGLGASSYSWNLRFEEIDGSAFVFLDEPDFDTRLTSPLSVTPSVGFLLCGRRVSVQTDSLVYFPLYYSNAPSGDGVLSVFSGVGSWISRAVQNISTMFWTAETGMTVLGYLAVASLALAVILLFFYLIAGWLKFH